MCKCLTSLAQDPVGAHWQWMNVEQQPPSVKIPLCYLYTELIERNNQIEEELFYLMTLHLPQQIEIIDFIAAFGLYLCLRFLISYYIHGSRTKGLMNLNFSGCPIKLIILHNSVYSLKSTTSSLLLFFLTAFLLKWSLYSGLLLVRTFSFVLTKVLTSKLSWGSIHRLCTSLVKLESTESLRNATDYTVLTCLNPFCLLHRLHFLQASSET